MKSKNKAIISMLLFIAASFVCINGYTQTYVGTPDALQGAAISGNLPHTINYLPFGNLNNRIEKAEATVNFRIGANDYLYGNNAISITLNFDIEARDAANNLIAGIFTTPHQTMVLTHDRPEMVFYKNFTQWSTGTNKVASIAVKNLVVTSTLCATCPAQILNDLVLEVNHSILYGVDVRQTSSGTALSVTPTSSVVNSKTVTLNWNNSGFQFQNYQVQFLRLHNTDPLTVNTQTVITTQVDWTKALNIETENNQSSVSFRIAEGTGFYVWRVRPLGTYHLNGSANEKNWGNWSTPAPAQGDILTNLTNGGLSVPYLYYNDPDDNRNWIYSRTFTEGNRQTESITYANGLQQVKQSQSYMPSTNRTIVNAPVLDNTGRPSLQTLPLPGTGNLTGYKNNFVTNPAHNLYTAEDFDKASNVLTPAQIDNTGAFSYYSGSNGNVASSEGYPYSRTVYFPDGTNRARIQTMPGSVHSLTGATGPNKTTNYFYDNPSDEELIKMFGDEAPDASQVLRTTVVDPNGIASVSYNHEGKVIATALGFTNKENEALTELNEGTLNGTMKDVVSDKMRIDDKSFITTKRISFTEDNNILTVDYYAECDAFGATDDCIKGKANYETTLRIKSIDDLTIIATSGPHTFSCPQAGNSAIATMTQTLPAGNYIVEKIVTAKGAVTEQSGTEMVQQVATALANAMSNVKTIADVRAVLNNVCAGTFDILQYPIKDADGNVTGYGDVKVTLDPVISPCNYTETTPLPSQFIITSPCCTLEVPVDFLLSPCDDPTILAITDIHARRDAIATQFEAYAFSQLGINYINYLPGFRYLDFKKMIFHMLDDEYTCGGTACDGTTDDLTAKVQYECADLWDCWSNIVNTTRDAIEEIEAANINSSVDDGTDDDNNDNGEPSGGDDSGFNLHFDENNDGNLLVQFLVGITLGNKMRDLHPEYTFNMMEEFMKCAGYKFAAIVVDGDCAANNCIDGGIYDNTSSVQNGYTVMSGDVTDYAFGFDGALPTGINSWDELYPNQSSPIFLFKYFEYTCGSNIACETLFDFCGTPAEDANPPCIPTACNSDFSTWTCANRYAFYNCIKTNQLTLPQEITTIDCPTASELHQMAVDKVDACNTACDDRSAEFRQRILQTLTAGCYVLVQCAADVQANGYTMADVDNMVTALVANCKTYCVLDDPTCEEFTCTDRIGNEYGYFNIVYNLCQLGLLEQARTSMFEIAIPSLCPGAPAFNCPGPLPCNNSNNATTTVGTSGNGVTTQNGVTITNSTKQ